VPEDPKTPRSPGTLATPPAKREEHNASALRGAVAQHGLRITGVEGRVGTLEGHVIGHTVTGKPVYGPAPTRVVPRPGPPPLPAITETVAAPHRDAALERAARQSDENLEMQATLGAVISHNGRVEAGVRDIATALCIVGRELGVEHTFPPSVRQSIPPPPSNAKPSKPRRTLPAISREQKIGAGVVSFLLVLRELLHLLHVLK